MKTNIFRKNYCRQYGRIIIRPLLATAACLLALAACQDEKEFLGSDITPGEVVTISLSPVVETYGRASLPPANAGVKPLSSGDGGATELDEDDYDLRYILEVYDGATMVGTRKVEIADDYTTPVNFSVELPAKPYTFVFWADFVTKGQTDDLTYKTDNAGGLTDIEWQASAYAIGDNLRDAYFATETIDLSIADVSGVQVTLHRPLGKLRILATDVKDYLDDNVSVTLGKAELTYTAPATFRTGFNALTGAPGTGTITVAAATCTPKLEASVTVAGQTYANVYVLAFDYFFVPAGLSDISFDFQLFDGSGAALTDKKTVTAAPVGVNKLTTVMGNVFNPGATMDANIADSFGDPESTLISGSPVPIPHWLDNTLVLDNATFLSAATLTWTNESVDSYEVVVNDGAPYSVTDNSKALDNLPEATAYTWKVRAVDDGKTSEWSYTKTFQTPAVPFIDKMVGSWGASDAEIKFWLGEGNEMGLDELLDRNHTTGAVAVAIAKSSSTQLQLTSVTGMNDHIGTGSSTSFDIDSQLANLLLAVDENAKTVSVTKSISSNNVYTKSMSMSISSIPNIGNILTDAGITGITYNMVMSGNIEKVALTVTGVEITGTLNANNELTCQFKYLVSTYLTTDIMDGYMDGTLNGYLPTPQYMLSEVEMTK